MAREYDMSNRQVADHALNLELKAAANADARKSARDISIPDIANPERREACRLDPELYLRTYMPYKFYNPFCRHHKAMIYSCEDRILHGGWQAMAAPRGDGKSSIVEGMVTRAINYGLRRFVVLIGATESDARDRKSAITNEYEENDLLLEDFPEICVPVRALDKSGRKGNMQTVDGVYTNIVWPTGLLAKEICFPTVEGSLASGSWIVVRGMEKGKIRGLKKGNLRPDLGILDDVESDDSARSQGPGSMTEKIGEKIDRAVIPLAGPNTEIAIFMPCTIIRRGCLADKVTDKANPDTAAWMGQRYALVERWPDCHGADGEKDLWAVYRRMRAEDQRAGDQTGRRAHRFYLADRQAMDEGCIISNEHRYVSDLCPDGSQLQVSAIQKVMNFISDKGDNARAWSAFRAEYQNQPDESNAPEGSDCTEEIIKSAVNCIPRGICPPGTTHLTAAMDLRKYELHWVVIAWVGSHGHIVDYGVDRVHSPQMRMTGDQGVTDDVKEALFVAMTEWRDRSKRGWPIEDTGEVKKLDRVFVDSRWQSDSVYSFIRQSPRPTYQAVTGGGGARAKVLYRPPRKNSAIAQVGRFHYYVTRPNERGTWLVHAEGDYWKSHVQDGFVIKVAKGDLWTLETQDALAVYGSDTMHHRDYASQIMAEELVSQYIQGKGHKTEWQVKHRSNHWLDATAYACCAAAMAGVRFGHMAEKKKTQRGRGAVQVVGSVDRYKR